MESQLIIPIITGILATLVGLGLGKLIFAKNTASTRVKLRLSSPDLEPTLSMGRTSQLLLRVSTAAVPPTDTLVFLGGVCAQEVETIETTNCSSHA